MHCKSQTAESHFNIKMSSCQYMKFQRADKIISWLSTSDQWIPFSDETAYLNWKSSDFHNRISFTGRLHLNIKNIILFQSGISFTCKITCLYWYDNLTFTMGFPILIRPYGGYIKIEMSCHQHRHSHYKDKIDGLVQERHNSIAKALELHLSCTNLSRWSHVFKWNYTKPERQSIHLNRSTSSY